MKTTQVLFHPATGNFVQRIHTLNEKGIVNVTRDFSKARRYSSEHAASEHLSFTMKHEGWVAKSVNHFVKI
jgi:hypothetical protein